MSPSRPFSLSCCLRFVQDYKPEDPKTHQGHDLNRVTMGDLYKAFGLNEDTMEFIGHSLALHRDDA